MEFLSFDSSSTIVQITEIENRRETPTHSTCFFFCFVFFFRLSFSIPRFTTTTNCDDLFAFLQVVGEEEATSFCVCVCGLGPFDGELFEKMKFFFLLWKDTQIVGSNMFVLIAARVLDDEEREKTWALCCRLMAEDYTRPTVVSAPALISFFLFF